MTVLDIQGRPVSGMPREEPDGWERRALVEPSCAAFLGYRRVFGSAYADVSPHWSGRGWVWRLMMNTSTLGGGETKTARAGITAATGCARRRGYGQHAG